MKTIKSIKQCFFIIACLLIFNLKGNAQCNIDFVNIFSSIGKSDTEFYSFAINKGYNYNSNEKIFECNNFNRLLRTSETVDNNSQRFTLAYSTTDSFNYMRIKEDAIRAGFQFSEELSNQKNGDVYKLLNSYTLFIIVSKYQNVTLYMFCFYITLTD